MSIARPFAVISMLIGTAALLASCAPLPNEPPDKPAASERPMLWPDLPDQPRFMLETTLRSPDDIRTKGEVETLRDKLIGDKPKFVPAFNKPYQVAARQGMLYITDTKSRLVHVFDIPRRTFFSMGLRKPGTLAKPIGIALDGDGNVYVADVSAKKIFVYDSLGLYLKEIGNPEDFARPTGVAVNAAGTRIYVIDSGGIETALHRVIAYDKDGHKLFTIGERGIQDGQFNLPTLGAVAPDGTLYVLDAGNFRVQAFDPDGKFLRKWGQAGNAPGNFSRPRGIAVDPDCNVYVTDASFDNVQIFNPQGQLLMAMGGPSREDVKGMYALIGGVAVDETGRVYLIDQAFGKLDVIKRLSDEEGKQLMAESKLGK
jgi:DNA-binding beta-propeller fold protein YncE